jgi:CelD/BcsL family acetyltransferase involved in cellulose biosynthesis
MSLFQTKEYQELFLKHFGGEVLWTEYGGFEVIDNRVVLLGMKPILGKEEVTDYGDIVAEDKKQAWKELIKEFNKRGVKKLQLDYVREDSETIKALKGLQGWTLQVEKQEVAPYIELPESWDEYLLSLERKQRKELKRKIRRLEEKNSFYQCKPETVRQDFEEFVKLHRLSDPDKNKFMSEKMKEFFWAVKTCKFPGWQSHLCFLRIDKKVVASVMTFESDDEVWLYNSGYDPEFSYYSVGLLLKSYKIKKAIEDGKKRYDFLRGNERYKYDLGAKDLQLYQIVIEW